MVVVVCLTLVSAGVAGLVNDTDSGTPTVESPALNSSETSDEGLLLDEHEEEATDQREEEYRQEVPSPGDPYFEASASDGSWVSYVNPRDEYREPYLGDGSGKICVSVYNADGQVAVGETVPNTTVSIPTGESTSWHSSADPFVVDLPLTDNYERPLDADQFGTDSDLPQGDGYLDSHCIELHGLPTDESVSYGEATVEGEFADRVEVVGYIQQAGQSWDSDIDPLAEARSYEQAGGGWTYEPGASHGQVTVVLQIDHPQTSDDSGDDNDTDDSGDGNDTDDSGDGNDTDDSGDDDTDDSGDDDTDDSGDDETNEEGTEEEESTSNTDDDPTQSDDDTVSGFGIAVAVISLLAVLVLTKRR
ncbi:PGF-CTERM sorting domain-containing protein [Natronoarchaeum sp. GCM10025321]|uniref:PGF-CTERM sorting domain-containing protein n=1 Tax=unclassified Natronoarchaeum TaxID=2620183 RepID=UPI003612E3FA